MLRGRGQSPRPVSFQYFLLPTPEREHMKVTELSTLSVKPDREGKLL